MLTDLNSETSSVFKNIDMIVNINTFLLWKHSFLLRSNKIYIDSA